MKSAITLSVLILSVLASAVDGGGTSSNYISAAPMDLSGRCSDFTKCKTVLATMNSNKNIPKLASRALTFAYLQASLPNATLTTSYAQFLSRVRNDMVVYSQNSSTSTNTAEYFSSFNSTYQSNCYGSQVANVNLPLYDSDAQCYDNYTAPFFPKVDEYALMRIGGEAVNSASGDPIQSLVADPNFLAWVTVIYNGTRYSTPGLPWATVVSSSSSLSGPITYYINYRTAIVTLTGGVISGIDWEHTNCNLKVGNCLYSCGSKDSVCPNKVYDMIAGCSQTGNTTCGMDVYIAWTGTDLYGNSMRSASQSIYRYENII